MKYSLLASSAIVAAGIAAIATGSAQAAPITGSDSILVGVTTPVPAGDDLFTATSLNLSSVLWGTGGGNFSAIPFLTPISNTTLTKSSLGSFTLDSVDGEFVAVASEIVGGVTYTSQQTGSTGSAISGTETLSYYFAGSFLTKGSTSAFGNNTASLTLSFTETGNGGPITPGDPGSFSVSATLGAPIQLPPPPPPPTPPPPPPPPTNVPEPASLAMLGAGLFGLGAVRRRRRS